MAKKNQRPAPAVSVSNQPQKVEFNPDYSMIKKDLVRIGVLAVFFISVLVVLSFILQ